MSDRTILLTNDDGILSESIFILKKALSPLGRIVIVSPSEERSGTSHSISNKIPVRIKEVDKDVYSVTGFPADCIYAAIHKLLNKKPDLVVSGIKKGANMGVDVYYSGTVAGIRQASIDGINGFAVSLDVDKKNQEMNWDVAADFSYKVADQMLKHGYKKNGFLNINCPNLPKEKVKGVRITIMGDRRYLTDVKCDVDPRGEECCWLWGEYSSFGPIKDSDCDAVNDGYISVSPMVLDITDYNMVQELKSWNL